MPGGTVETLLGRGDVGAPHAVAEQVDDVLDPTVVAASRVAEVLLTTPVPTAPANNTSAAAAERVRMRVDMNFPSERNRRHSAPNPESWSGQQTVAGIRVTLTDAEDELAVDEVGARWWSSSEAAGSGSATAQDCVPTVGG